MKRVFVRAMSRSGGTLMCTILDAHPDIAMGYELYENMLTQLGDESAVSQFNLLAKLRRQAPSKTHKVFAARALRGGVDYKTFDRLVWDHIDRGEGFKSFAGRMLFIEKLLAVKRQQEGKPHWGAKIVNYEPVLETFPPEECFFLFMQRDGRDVAASEKHVRDFKKTIEEVAESWKSQIQSFKDFSAKPGVNAHIVRYESLAKDPEQVCRELCEFLGVKRSDRMLHSHELDLSIHRNPTGHLSKKQIKQAINTKSVGRYKSDLTKEERSSFNRVAKDMLSETGYR